MPNTTEIGKLVAEIVAEYRRKNPVKTVSLSQSVKINYRRAAVNPDGSVVWFNNGDWDHNLVLDSGLNEVAARVWCELFNYGVVGTGTNPVDRDSGATTFTVSAGTVTASAGFFEAGDTGRLLRLDTEEAGYLTYVSPTSATWSGPATVAVGQLGTIYYVNRTALQTETKRTNTYRTSAGDNSSTWNGTSGDWTYQRTYIFTTESGNVTYREIGWSWGSTGTALFGIDILPGAGDSLVSGQQYLIQVQVVLRLSPIVSTTSPNIGTGGWNTEGDCSLNDINTAGAAAMFSSILSTGATSTGLNGTPLEPSYTHGSNGRIGACTANFTLVTATTSGVTPPTNVAAVWGNSAYVAGTFTRTKGRTFGINEANVAHYGCFIGHQNAMGFTVKYDTPQTKTAVYTLALSFRFTWGRRF